MDIELTEPRTDQEFEDYYRLRYERLRKPLGLPPGSERDSPAEASSIHMIATVDGRVVGAGCWVVGMGKNEQTGAREVFVRFRQMAIDEEFEGQGIGKAMTLHVEDAARRLGATKVVGNVRLDRISYFEQRGWVIDGTGKTMFDRVEHVSMSRPLS